MNFCNSNLYSILNLILQFSLKGVKNGSTYSYRVIYSNEFGSSLSDYSNWIKITYTNITCENSTISLTNDSMLIDFGFTIDCNAPTVVNLNWNTLNFIQISTYLMSYLQEQDISAFYRINLTNFSVIIRDINRNSSFSVAISNKNINRKDIRHLKPSNRYSFKLELAIEYVLIKRNSSIFKLVSDTKECKTISIAETFASNSLNLESNCYIYSLFT